MRVIVAAVVAVVLFGVALGGSYALSLRAIDGNDQQWCATLSLLTSHPVPKPSDAAANPSREENYVFYSDLRELRSHYGCG